MEGALLALVVFACPVGMGVMMWLMHKGTKGGAKPRRPSTVEELRSEHDRLSAQIQRLEHGELSGNGEVARR